MAWSTQCFLHYHPLSKIPSVPLRGVLPLKPNQLVCCAQKDDNANNHVFVSRRLALTLLIGAAAIASKVSPADAAYGESGIPALSHV